MLLVSSGPLPGEGALSSPSPDGAAGSHQAGETLADAQLHLPVRAGAGGLCSSGLVHRPPLMCFTHVTNIEGICFLKPVLIEIAHKPAHAWSLPVSYYYFFHFGGRLCFLGKQEKQRGKKALFVSLAWSWILERFPVVEMTVWAALRHQRVPSMCKGLAWGKSATPQIWVTLQGHSTAERPS